MTNLVSYPQRYGTQRDLMLNTNFSFKIDTALKHQERNAEFLVVQHSSQLSLKRFDALYKRQQKIPLINNTNTSTKCAMSFLLPPTFVLTLIITVSRGVHFINHAPVD